MNIKSARKPKPSQAMVVSNTLISPNMRRVIVQSEAFTRFKEEDLGGYVKLLFHPHGHTDIQWLDDNERPIMRTYTISDYDAKQGCISLDFAQHKVPTEVYPLTPEQGGYAMMWANQAKEGDRIYIGGPGKSQSVVYDSHCLLVADMTAIPAMQAQCRYLDAQAQGHVVVQLSSSADQPVLNLPKGMSLSTVIGEDPALLADKVQSLPLHEKALSIWCACEFNAMKAIRNHLNQLGLVARQTSYFSSYWKQGVTEDGHKQIKREDAETYCI